MRYYAKSTNGFYDTDIDGERTIIIADPVWTPPPNSEPDLTAPTITVPNPACTIPADAVEITDAEHRALMQGQADGLQIVADAKGRPIAVAPPPLSAEELRAAAQRKRDSLLRLATQRMEPLQDAVDLGMATDEESAALLAWKRYRVALNRVDLAKPVWPVPPEPVEVGQ
jgi:hypothetical protein